MADTKGDTSAWRKQCCSYMGKWDWGLHVQSWHDTRWGSEPCSHSTALRGTSAGSQPPPAPPQHRHTARGEKPRSRAVYLQLQSNCNQRKSTWISREKKNEASEQYCFKNIGWLNSGEKLYDRKEPEPLQLYFLSCDRSPNVSQGKSHPVSPE